MRRVEKEQAQWGKLLAAFWAVKSEYLLEIQVVVVNCSPELQREVGLEGVREGMEDGRGIKSEARVKESTHLSEPHFLNL